ncbi:SRPBCC family protein [Sphingomonas sp. 1P06PA]|uniref:SRPBCC family protein n=1 Tax=Sphingomonas sp. 1P06PA TaxID=554121 RepID=UPI0039A67D06
MIRVALAGALLATPLPVAAKVASVGEAGMVVENEAFVAAPPAAVWAVLIEPKRWWQAAHSWSGKAENFSLDLRAGGCFCESLPGGGSVEHLRVVYADPGKLLRLTGGLGPLQGDAATGPLSWTLQPDGQGTRIVQRYAVSGVARTPWPVMAPLIDSVLRQQLDSLAKTIASLRK